jgi:hypothetical protein
MDLAGPCRTYVALDTIAPALSQVLRVDILSTYFMGDIEYAMAYTRINILGSLIQQGTELPVQKLYT